MNYRMFATACVMVIIVLVMIAGTFYMSCDAKDRFVTLGIFGLSIALGAVLGTAIAPFNDSEERKFSNYGKAIGVFITGYIASKADLFISKAFDPQTYTQMDHLESFRWVASFAIALSVAKLTFAFRSYGSGQNGTL